MAGTESATIRYSLLIPVSPIFKGKNMLNFLLLEDDEFDVYLIKKVFQRANISFTVTTVSDKDAFLQAIENDTFDAILADHSLPHFNALEALHIINDRHVHTAFIIITGTMSEEYAVNVMKEGASDYILKDRLQRLPSAVLSAIERNDLKAEREKYLADVIAREALMKEAERLARFGSFSSDLRTGTAYWSDGLYNILGYRPGDVPPTFEHFLARIHPEDAAYVKQINEATLLSLTWQQYDCRLADDNGKITHIHTELFVTRSAGGAAIHLNGFVRDVTSGKEAELKLKESEEKYRHLFENNPIPLLVFEEGTFRYLDVNTAALKHYGYSREEFLNMTALDIRPADERNRFVHLDRTGGGGFSKKGVWKHLKKDGSIIFVEISVNSIIFEGRNARLILSNDITDKMIAENKLKRNQAQLITSQRIAHIGSWEVELKVPGNYLSSQSIRWTDETYRIFGVDPNLALTSDFFLTIIHPDDHHILEHAYRVACETDGEYKAEFRILLPDGTQRIVSELGEVIYDSETNEPVKITGTAQDITERKKAEELLQKSEANLRSIFNNTETAYVLLDMELNVLSCNQPALKFSRDHLGAEIQEKAYAVDYFSEDKKAIILKSLRSSLKGEDIHYEVSFDEPDGSSKWYYAHFHPVWSQEEKILGVIMSLRDINERKLSELQQKKITEELIQRNKDLEQFAYIISHNLRAPVANIRGISEALSDGDLTEQDRHIFTDGLIMSAKKLDNVIMDLNHILQVKHEINENKEKVQFSQIVSDIKYSISNLADKEMFLLKCNFSEIDEMMTLKSYIHSIFYNLISNSIKYRQAHIPPVIEITSHKYPDRIELTFKDNSIGIDLEKKGDQIFGLYKRFHPQRAEGKGMGLYMVKTQVETLHGKISVQSKVNEGTEFKIVFRTQE